MSFFKTNTDKNLIAQLKKADANAFKVIFEQYWAQVYTICYNNTGSREDAKELTQEIFLSLWERKTELEITGPLEHYLNRAAKLQIFNHFRNKSIKAKHLNCIISDYCDTDNCTENEIYYNQLDTEVKHLVDKLPCQCKTIYEMSKEQHLSNKEIADTLNITIKTVEYHITNARKFLQKALSEHYLFFLLIPLGL